MVKVLVTGSAGLLGKHICQELHENYEVVGTVRREAQLHTPWKSIIHDWKKKAAVDIDAADILFHAAFVPVEGEDPQKKSQHNIKMAKYALKAAENLGCKLLVLLSTGSVYKPTSGAFTEKSETWQDSKNDYIESSLQIQKMFEDSKIPTLVFRLFHPYGPEQQATRLVPRLISSVRNKLPVKINGEEAKPRLSPIHVNDASNLIVRVFQKYYNEKTTENEIFNIGGPEVFTVADLARHIAKNLEVEPQFEVANPVDFDCFCDNSKVSSYLGTPLEIRGFVSGLDSLLTREEKLSQKQSMNHILITGGAGFIGSHAVDRFLAAGYKVSVLDNYLTGSPENLEHHKGNPNLVLQEGDIKDEHMVRSIMKDIDIVLHMAVENVRASLSKPVSNHDTNATGTLLLLNHAYKCGVKKFVYCSSSEIYGNSSEELLLEDETIPKPVTVYGAAKLAGELYTLAFAQTYGMKVTVVRPFNAYGPRSHETGNMAEVIPRFLIRVLNGKSPIIFGSGDQGRDFTYVTDVAEGLYASVNSEKATGQIVNIAYGQMFNIKEVATKIIAIANQAGQDLKPEFSDPRPGDVNKLKASTEKAESMLGYKAQIPFTKGLKKYFAWLKENRDYKNLLEDDVKNWEILPHEYL